MNDSNAANVENERVGEKGGGVYSDFDLFDPEANEVARYHRSNFHTATSFHTRAGIVVVDRSTGQQASYQPFGERDSRLTSLMSTASGFVAGGFVVQDAQFGALPAIVYWNNSLERVDTLVLEDGFNTGSHWIDDVVEIGATTFIVVGASTVQRRSRGDTGWIALVDTETGTLTRLGENFPSHGRTLRQRSNEDIHVITDDQIMQVSPQGQVVWSVSNKDTLRGATNKGFIPRSTVMDLSGNLWVAGNAAKVNDGWGAWITQVSSTGEILFGFYFRSQQGRPRFVDLVPSDDGGVLAIGSLYCHSSRCGHPFARGFLLRFGTDGQIEEAEMARFETFSSRREENDFYNVAPRECTRVDAKVCDAVATLSQH